MPAKFDKQQCFHPPPHPTFAEQIKTSRPWLPPLLLTVALSSPRPPIFKWLTSKPSTGPCRRKWTLPSSMSSVAAPSSTDRRSRPSRPDWKNTSGLTTSSPAPTAPTLYRSRSWPSAWSPVTRSSSPPSPTSLRLRSSPCSASHR